MLRGPAGPSQLMALNHPQQECPEGQLGPQGPASLGLGDMAEQGTQKIPSGAALGQACSHGTSSLLGQLPGEMPAHRPPGRPGPLCTPAVSAARYIPPHPQISALGAPLSLGQPDPLEEWDGLQCPLNGPGRSLSVLTHHLRVPSPWLPQAGRPHR